MRKKRATKSAKKAKARDLPTKKGAAAVKGGATATVTDVKDNLQGTLCWRVGVSDQTLRS